MSGEIEPPTPAPSSRKGPSAKGSSTNGPVSAPVLGPDGPGRSARFAILALYAASGAAGLIYEVAWGRRLSLVLGATAVSGAVVLSAFLGALGVGARLGGRVADRVRSPLRAYGFLELGAAFWALLVPFVIPSLEAFYVALAQDAGQALRITLAFLTACVAVGPAALLLGATFPCVLRTLATGPRSVGASSSLLYGVNTVGAVAGALWAGFSGIATFGVGWTSRIAAFLAIVVGVAALLIARRAERVPPIEATAAPSVGPRAPRTALAAAFASGLIALGLEAAGFRILVFFIEGFTVSFAAMLGVFLAGLALGSLVVGPLIARQMRAPAAFGVLLVSAGAAVLVLGACVPSLEGWLRGVRDAASTSGDPASALRWTALYGSFLLFFAPSLLLGAAYPICLRWAGGTDVRGLGVRIGRVALWNSVGAVAGPLLVLLVGLLSGAGTRPGGPLLAWTLLGLVAIVVGAATLLPSIGLPRKAIPVVGVLAGLALGFGGPVRVLSATPEALVRASRVVRDRRGEVDVRRVLVDVRADETTTASVIELPSAERILYTDDFAAAATGFNYPYMRMLGHLPGLLARDPHNAMVIAFGTGTTAGSLAITAPFARIEIVEVSRAVYALSSRFDGVNRGVLEDPRVVRRVDDGRHALLLHEPDLDAITLEPLMPYTPAALPFYTREFYELARDRLRDGGVICQWVPVHAMRLDVYAALLRTFFETFPDGSLWFFEQSTVLFARKGSDAPPIDGVVARAKGLFKSLHFAGFSRPTAIGSAYVASGRRVLEVIDDASKSGVEAMRTHVLGPLSRRVVTDDDPFPEFHPSPRAGIVTSYEADTLLWLEGLIGSDDDAAKNPLAVADGVDTVPVFRATIKASLAARSAEARGDFLSLIARDAEDLAKARANFEAAVTGYEATSRAFEGGDISLDLRRARLSRRLLALAARSRMADADRAQRTGDTSAESKALEEALALAERAFEVDPMKAVPTERPQAMALVAEVLARAGRCAEALDRLRGPRTNWPRDPSLSDVSVWLSARVSGLDTNAHAYADRGLVKRLALARPCSGTALGRIGSTLKEFRKHLTAGDAIAFRKAAALLLAGRSDWAEVTDDVVASLREHRDPLAPDVDAERAALVRILAPSDDRLTTLLASDDRDRRTAALRTAAHFGFVSTNVWDAVRTSNARSPDAARRAEFAELALGDRSPEVRELVVELLADADATVRKTAWRSLTGDLSDEARAAMGYDPEGPDAARDAALPAVRARLLGKTSKTN